MRKHSFLVTFVFILVFAAHADAQKRLGERFDLGVGESVLIIDAGIHVGYDRIVGDSRCPHGVECIWEGNAAARVWGKTTRTNRTFFELNTNPRFRTEDVFRGFVIRLLNVTPHPEDGVIIDPEEYVVTMVVVHPEEAVPVEPRTWGAIKQLFR